MSLVVKPLLQINSPILVCTKLVRGFRSSARKYTPETGHLFGTMESHQVAGNCSFTTTYGRPGITRDKTKTAQNKRSLPHPKQTTRTFPERVATYQVCFAAIMKPHWKFARGARADTKLSMMKAHLFGERSRLPAFHPGCRHRNPIDRACLYR